MVFFQLATLGNANADPNEDPPRTDKTNDQVQKVIRTIPAQ